MSDAPRQPPPKKEVALALLEESSMFIHLDPRREGVTVPKWFTGQPQLVLQVGLNMAIPIPDLKVDETGISCTLSFNRAPFWCHIPWGSIYALVGEDGRGGVWAEDVPPEIQLQRQGPPQKQAPKKKPPKLAAVGSRPREQAEQAEQTDQAEQADELSAVEAKQPEVSEIPRGPRPVPRLRPVETEASDRLEPGGAETPAPAAQVAPGKKPKREIPPYLKVIK
jgi:hypothetical protein